MKIVIERGETVEKALEYLIDILTEKSKEYPYLKGNMNVYLTLKNDQNLISPENEKEFLIKHGDVLDADELEKKAAYNDTLNRWKRYVMHLEFMTRTIKHKVELDEIYLETAEEKKRKPENIAKRKIQYDENKKTLEKNKNKLDLLYFLNEIIQEGRYLQYYKRIQYGKYSRKETEVYCFFVFNNINGYVGYYDGYALKDGLPE